MGGLYGAVIIIPWNLIKRNNLHSETSLLHFLSKIKTVETNMGWITKLSNPRLLIKS